MIIALASPRIAPSLDDGLERVARLVAQASFQGARVVCFPEAYLPGLRGLDFEVPAYSPDDAKRVIDAVSAMARTHRITSILGMETFGDAGRHIAAAVFAADGELLGIQTKVQLDPSEDAFYAPGTGRQIYEVENVKFGVSICHEGWRYPETVRWAAVRGAQVVFHPHHAGSDIVGSCPRTWGAPDAAYYERAMQMRSIENGIYFASVNYAMRYQESATTLIDPDGRCQAYLPYGEEGVLVQPLDLNKATGLLARRYAPERY